MKKIDFHIHTVETFSDAPFQFSLDTLKRYVGSASLDAIAITNHDVFDSEQFCLIRDALDLDAIVFPGIEINLEKGHLLLISDGQNLDDFQAKADEVSKRVTCVGECISVQELKAIYGDLNKYLLIPHYDKKPSLRSETIAQLSEHMPAGEVSSAKKFIYAVKDEAKLTPVLFSDIRIREGLEQFPTRQTFIDCGDVTISSIKQCFQDKGKVTLSESDGNKLFAVFDDGQILSTGLNILLGSRSSGKTYTLDRINASNENVKYIKQFSLVQQDDEAYKKEFNTNVKTKRSQATEQYLLSFKHILDEVMDIDLGLNEKEVEDYVTSLLKSAERSDKQDAFSRMTLFNETFFDIGDDATLKELIESVRQVVESIAYRATIEKHIDLLAMKNLACDLISQLWNQALDRQKKTYVDSIVKDIKRGLKLRTAAVQAEDVDLFRIAMDKKRVDRFTEIVNFLKTDFVIERESIQNFTVIAKKRAFANATEVGAVYGKKRSFSEAFSVYGSPYDYLKRLLAIDELPRNELYKLFAHIDYQILNIEGNGVSGGERSEFRLLQEINEAQNYDMLLIDEPESSFDNVFLNSSVNKMIKDISETMPVVVVTHNSTVGASIGSDYVLYACKENQDGVPTFKLYSGHPTDKKLSTVDGQLIANHTIMMDALEAGVSSYQARSKAYVAIKN